MGNCIISSARMRAARFLLVFGALSGWGAFAACGARTPLLVLEGDESGFADGAKRDGSKDANGDTVIVDLCPGADVDGGPCTGIACNIPDCRAGKHTTVTATV